jgi:hypothetical protein
MKLSLVAVALAGCGSALAAPKDDKPAAPPATTTKIVSHDADVDAKVQADDTIVATLKSAKTLFSEPCRAPYHLQVKDGDKWTDVVTELPAKGNYWLDGQHHGYGMCDDSPCQNAPGELDAHLGGYRQTGNKDGAPVFERYDVKGTIKVTFVYSTTQQCEYKTFDVVVSR